MIGYNNFIINRTLFSSFNILFSLFIIYLFIKSFTNLLDINTIYCIDNDNNANNNQVNNWFGTVANIAISGGIAYGALRGGLAVSNSLTAAPPQVKVGAFYLHLVVFMLLEDL